MAGSLTTVFLLAVVGQSSAATPWDDVAPGTISFREMGLCGNGETAMYGWSNPAKLTHPDKFWVEVMGGATCFNRGSCLNKNIGISTMGIRAFMRHNLGVPESMIATLASGENILLQMVASLKPGYLPVDDSHPMAGRRGVFLVSCTGDIAVGHRNVTYTDGTNGGVAEKGTCNETLSGPREYGYRGCQNVTISGVPCQKWSSQVPHKHNFWNLSHPHLIAAGIGGESGDHNYCRNPDSSKTIWCYTTLTGSNTRYEYCNPKGVVIPPYHAHHMGGKNMYDMLKLIHKNYPGFTDIAIYGGSGGGVSASAWISPIADIWTKATVTGFVDSGLHLFPGTQLFQTFYDQGSWGPGPAGQGAGLDTSFPAPDFDWRKGDAIAAHVASFDGRVRLGYLSCIDDHIVFSDRLMMLQYAGFDPDSKTAKDTEAFDLVTHARQQKETWEFLNNMHQCTPSGTVFSYIQNCSHHHQTRNGWAETVPGFGVTAEEFTTRILAGLPPNANNVSQARFWYKSVPPQVVTCSSPVRRRRVPESTILTTTATTTVTEKGEPVASSSYVPGIKILILLLVACIYMT